MNDTDGTDGELELRLRNHMLGFAVARPAETVVAQAMAGPSTWMPWPNRWSRSPLAIVLLVMTVGGAAAVASLMNSSGSRPGTATVGGVQYTLAAARSLSVPAELLESYGVASSVEEDPAWFESLTVFSIQGVDSAKVLVLKLRPGAADDAGPLGSYFLLIRGPDAFLSLCKYFDPASEATPRDCLQPNP